jgi:hypothetical protein
MNLSSLSHASTFVAGMSWLLFIFSSFSSPQTSTHVKRFNAQSNSLINIQISSSMESLSVYGVRLKGERETNVKTKKRKAREKIGEL